MRKRVKYRIAATIDNMLEERGHYKTEMIKNIANRFGMNETLARNYVNLIFRYFCSQSKIEEMKIGGETIKDFYIKNSDLYFAADGNQKTISDFAMEDKNVICL